MARTSREKSYQRRNGVTSRPFSVPSLLPICIVDDSVRGNKEPPMRNYWQAKIDVFLFRIRTAIELSVKIFLPSDVPVRVLAFQFFIP